MRGAALAAAAAALLVALGLAVPLTRPEPRLLSTNQHPNFGPAAFLAPGAEACQIDEDLPGEARTVRFAVGADAIAGPVSVTYRRAGRVIARGRSQTFTTGPLAVPLTGVEDDALSVELCVRNEGRVALSLGGAPAGGARDAAGSLPLLENPAEVAGQAQPGRMRVEYPLDGARSPLSIARRVADRAGLLKASFIGGWTIWLALVLTLAAGAVGVVAVARAER